MHTYSIEEDRALVLAVLDVRFGRPGSPFLPFCTLVEGIRRRFLDLRGLIGIARPDRSEKSLEKRFRLLKAKHRTRTLYDNAPGGVAEEVRSLIAKAVALEQNGRTAVKSESEHKSEKENSFTQLHRPHEDDPFRQRKKRDSTTAVVPHFAKRLKHRAEHMDVPQFRKAETACDYRLSRLQSTGNIEMHAKRSTDTHADEKTVRVSDVHNAETTVPSDMEAVRVQDPQGILFGSQRNASPSNAHQNLIELLKTQYVSRFDEVMKKNASEEVSGAETGNKERDTVTVYAAPLFQSSGTVLNTSLIAALSGFIDVTKIFVRTKLKRREQEIRDIIWNINALGDLVEEVSCTKDVLSLLESLKVMMNTFSEASEKHDQLDEAFSRSLQQTFSSAFASIRRHDHHTNADPRN